MDRTDLITFYDKPGHCGIIVVLYSKGPPLAFYEDYDLNVIFKTTYKGRDTSTNRESPGDPCALGPLVPDLCCTPSSAIVNRHVSVI